MTQQIEQITQSDQNYPVSINTYLKTDTPEIIWARGNINLLPAHNKTSQKGLWGLFCSSKCPAEIILKAHDLAQTFKDTGTSTIGGFHSPIEKECLRVMLRGTQPIIMCPAREIEKMRLKPEWKKPLAEERLLFLSLFDNPRVSEARSRKRNAFVAALSTKICIAHAAEDSKTLEFAKTILSWGKPVFTFDSLHNKALLQLGAQKLEASQFGGK